MLEYFEAKLHHCNLPKNQNERGFACVAFFAWDDALRRQKKSAVGWQRILRAGRDY